MYWAAAEVFSCIDFFRTPGGARVRLSDPVRLLGGHGDDRVGPDNRPAIGGGCFEDRFRVVEMETGLARNSQIRSGNPSPLTSSSRIWERIKLCSSPAGPKVSVLGSISRGALNQGLERMATGMVAFLLLNGPFVGAPRCQKATACLKARG
jgi:hypothetical protein